MNTLKKIEILAEKHWPDDKWDLLYTFALKAFDFEVQRFHRLDDKATKLLTAISVVITLSITAFNIVDDSSNSLSGYIDLVAGLVFTFLCIAWWAFFSCLRLTSTSALAIEKDPIPFYKEKNIATIRISIFKGCQKAISERRDKSEQKANYLVFGYNATLSSFILLIVLVVSIYAEKHNIAPSSDVNNCLYYQSPNFPTEIICEVSNDRSKNAATR